MSRSEVSEILKGRKVIAHDVEAVLTSYLVGMPDSQRGQWTPNYADTAQGYCANQLPDMVRGLSSSRTAFRAR
jgi:hypothetical protein